MEVNLAVAVVAHVMTVATIIQPVDGWFIPKKRSTALAAGPVGAAVEAIFGEEVRQESSEACVPRYSGMVRVEGKGATGLL